MSGILLHHKDQHVTYELDEEGNVLYEQIVN